MATLTTNKNKRLGAYDRETLLSFARKQVAATADASELDAAYERAADAIHAAVIAKAPQKDMAVLARYDCAKPDACVYVSTGGNNYQQFKFKIGDARIALRPDKGGCHRNPLLLTGEAEDAFDNYLVTLKASTDVRDSRVNDFKALIYGTPTFNALVDIWPAAEALRTTIVGTSNALSVLSSDVVSRIKADAALAYVEQAA